MKCAYKFYRLNSNFLKSLKGEYFYFPDKSELNDSFELRFLPVYGISPFNFYFSIKNLLGSLGKPITTKNLFKLYFKNLFSRFLTIFRPNSKYMQDLSDSYSAENIQFGICCFSKNCLSLLLWAHYADSSKGVCLIFDSELLGQNGLKLIPVKYQNTLPKFDLLELNKAIKKKTSSSARRILTTKPREWSYENEWRLIKKLSSKQDKKVSWPKGSLVGVIFGEHTRPLFRKMIKSYIETLQPSVNFFSIKRNVSHYSLVLQT